MSDAYRVIVFGPGGLGGVAVSEIAQSTSLQLVGVRAYSEDKKGVDAGTLIGLEPLGVTVSADLDEVLAVEADCVLYCARDFGNFNTDDELLQILASGKNVVTPLPYHDAELYRDPSFVSRLDEACRVGGSVFHATGLDPDVVSGRLLLSLTDMCNDIESIRLQEQWEADCVAGELLTILGFGQPPETAEQSPFPAGVSTNFLQANGLGLARALGLEYSRWEETHEFVPSPVDFQSRNLFVASGTVGRITHRFQGWTKTSGDEPFYTMEYNWFLGHHMLPDGLEPNQYFVVNIEGRPSVHMAVDLRTSLKQGSDRFYDIGNMRTEPGYHAIVAPCLHAIPLVCGAKPGVLPTFIPQLRWAADLRVLSSPS